MNLKCCIYLCLTVFLFQACCSVNKSTSSSAVSLTSLEWRLVTLNTNDKTLTAEGLKTPATLKINPDGQFSGNGGCNNFFGQAVIKGKNIRFGNAGITKKMCLDSEATTIENAYMKALSEIDSYVIESGNLKLKKGNIVVAIFSTFR